MGNEKNQGKDNNPNRDQYIIDETVELKDYDGNQGYVWEIDEDIDPESEYVIRAIVRDEGSVKPLILPKEEAEAFKNGDNYWPEWSSSGGDKVKAKVRVNTEDEDPYFHSGDLKLAITKSSRNPSRVTVKFRQAE